MFASVPYPVSQSLLEQASKDDGIVRQHVHILCKRKTHRIDQSEREDVAAASTLARLCSSVGRFSLTAN